MAPHTLLADHLVSDISTFTICIQCVGVRLGKEWDKLNMGEVGLNGFIFTSTLVWGEKMRVCDNYSANYFHSNLPCHLHNLLITDF